MKITPNQTKAIIFLFFSIFFFVCFGMQRLIAQEPLVLGTVVNQPPHLPKKVTLGSNEVPVTWDDISDQGFGIAFEKVNIHGHATVNGHEQPVVASVWVLPEHLVYLIDAGRLSPNQSQLFDAAKQLRGAALLNDQPDKKVLSDADKWGYIERNSQNNQRVNLSPGNAGDWATSFIGDDNNPDEGLTYRFTLQPGMYKITVAHVPRSTGTFASWLNVNHARVSSKVIQTTVLQDSIHPPIYVSHELRLTQPTTISYETQKTGGYAQAHISLLAVEQIGSNISMPVASPISGDYWEPQTVQLSHKDSQAVIHYTLDGSRPDKNSKQYTSPIPIDKTTRISAIAYVGNKASKVTTTDLAINHWAVTASVFKLAGEQAVNNVKVHWEQRKDVELYKVYRNGKFIGQSSGDVFDDYNLPVGRTYTYYVAAYKGEQQMATAIADKATTFTPADSGFIYDNHNGKNNIKRPRGFQIANQYYAYDIRQIEKTIDGKTSKGRAIYEKVSPNGFDQWTERELAFYPNANFEGVGMVYNQETKKVVIVAHYEDQGGYVAAKLYIGQVTPKGKLEVTFCARPLGFDSRDQSLFVDDDHTAYILSATHMNQDVNIYKLDKSWSRPVSLVNTIFKGQHRETPYIIKKDGEYYFFSSKASGWYPSQAMYASATDLAGVWTQLKELGNNSTFGTQANSVSSYGVEHITYGMHGYHWGSQYIHKDPAGNYARLLVIHFNAGYASMEYYNQVEYHEKYGLIPVQAGRNLTLGKPVTASQGDGSSVTDGADMSSSDLFKGIHLPYSLTIDMEKNAKITEINLSTKLTGGSETAYKYTIEASQDGKTFKTIVDHLNNWQVGFHILPITDPSSFRYIRLNVHKVINVHNNNSADWADGIFEMTAFGTIL